MISLLFAFVSAQETPEPCEAHQIERRLDEQIAQIDELIAALEALAETPEPEPESPASLVLGIESESEIASSVIVESDTLDTSTTE